MITNEKMAVNTAKKIVSYLNSKGIKAESEFKYEPIKKCLRYCYYVKKLLECGRTDCVHIDIEGSFFVVTDDCMLMSGHNAMIVDGLYAIYLDYVDEENKDINYPHYEIQMKSYCDEGCDNGMFLVNPQKFIDWLESKNLYE